MKKSIFFIILALVICIVSITAANLKLKQEYTKGNYTNPYIKTSLPSFAYIKEDVDYGNGYNYSIDIVAEQSKDSYSMVDSTQINPLLFTVKNDTLFITRNSKIAMEEYGRYLQIRLFTPSLKYISSSATHFSLNRMQLDSLSVAIKRNVSIRLLGVQTKSLKIDAGDKTKIEMQDIFDIPSFELTLREKSTLTANNVSVQNRVLNISDSATINLDGRSLASLNVKQ